MDLASRLGAAHRADVPPFYVMDQIAAFAQRMATHRDGISLMAGQPSTGAPKPVAEEAVRLLSSGDPLGYTGIAGVPALRRGIAGHYREWYGVDVDPDDIVVTTGASGAFLLAFLACFEPGDKIAMACPSYPAYRNDLQVLGCEVVEIATGPETAYQPTVEQLEAIPDLKGVIVASPSNPAGTLLADDELKAIALWCDDHAVRFISDEIYHGLEYGADGEPVRAASTAREFSTEAIVIGSFSKYFSMTGWRLGWMIIPPQLRRAIEVLSGNFTICPPAISQHAAVKAFTPESYDELDGHIRHYADNRRALLAGLPQIGITGFAPALGAFYVYADIGHVTHDSLTWCRQLLDDTGVALASGVDFDPTNGGSFVRISFAGSRPDIEAGLARLGDYLS